MALESNLVLVLLLPAAASALLAAAGSQAPLPDAAKSDAPSDRPSSAPAQPSEPPRAAPDGVGAPSTFRVVELANGRVVRSAYEFTYEDVTNKELAWFRKSEGLDDVVAGADTEFEMIKRLAAWTAEQWMYGGRHRTRIFPGSQAIADLRQGRGQGASCGMFCTVFMAACHSFGIHTRALSVGTDVIRTDPKSGKEKRYWHAVADVWSNDHAKWVLVDGNFACYFEDARGVPMSIFELQAALLSGRTDGVRQVYCGGYSKATLPIFKRYPNFRDDWIVETYGHLRIFRHMDMLMANNLLSPSWEPSRIGPNGDHRGAKRVYYVPPVEGFKPFLSNGQHYETTRRRRDVDWTLNDVELTLPGDGASVPGPAVRVAVETFAPSLDCFLVRTDGGDWRNVPPDEQRGHDATLTVEWPLHRGLNTLEVRTRNALGRLGPLRRVRVSDDPLSAAPTYAETQSGFGADGVGSVVAAPDKDGRLWITRAGNLLARGLGRDAEQVTLQLPAAQETRITKFAIGPKGQIFVAAGHTLYKCRPNGEVVWRVGDEGAQPGQFRAIGGVAVDARGRAYVSDADCGRLARVQVFAPNGEHLRTIGGAVGSAAGQFNLPAELAVSRAGALYVADAGNHRIQVFDSAGRFLRQIGPDVPAYGRLHFPSGLAVARLGGRDVVLIADTFNHQIVLTETDGALIGFFGGYTPTHEKGRFCQPRGVAADAEHMYVLQPPHLHVFDRRR